METSLRYSKEEKQLLLHAKENFLLDKAFFLEMKELTCDVQGKKTLPVTDNGLLSVDLKGGYNFNPRSRKGKPRGVVELSYKVFNFTEDQDLKFKIGCNVFKQTPYFQLRENNWTLNHELNVGWNVIYDL